MNTKWIVGCVVFNGLDTKLMQNQNQSHYKQSRLEKEYNITVVRMLLFHVIASLLLAWQTIRWESLHQESDYYLFGMSEEEEECLKKPCV